MKEKNTTTESASTVCYEMIKARARSRIQEWLQDLLEAEVTEFLGRGKSQRREAHDLWGYRNGHGKPRRIALTSGTITVRRPRMRNLAERFESRVLPMFKRRTKELGAMLPELYLHGLSSGDFELALRGLLGEGAPLSAASLSRLKGAWQAEYESWKRADLSELELVYEQDQAQGQLQGRKGRDGLQRGEEGPNLGRAERAVPRLEYGDLGCLDLVRGVLHLQAPADRVPVDLADDFPRMHCRVRFADAFRPRRP